MSDEKVYYLVFSESTSYYLSRWFRLGYGHVHAFHHTEGHWFLIDPAIGALNFTILCKAKGLDFIGSYSRLFPNHKILPIAVKENKDMPVWRIGPISCVSTIQYLIGVYWPLTLTPWQLYSRLTSKPPKHIRILPWDLVKQNETPKKQDKQPSEKQQN